MAQPRSRYSWLPLVSTLLSIAACYGTLAMIAALGAIGIALAVSDAVWAAAIAGFAGVAVLGLVVSYTCHRKLWPLAIGLVGFLAIIYAVFIEHHRATEFAGFLLLAIAAIWDWQLRKSEAPMVTQEPDG
jgi:hypothetical protein